MSVNVGDYIAIGGEFVDGVGFGGRNEAGGVGIPVALPIAVFYEIPNGVGVAADIYE